MDSDAPIPLMNQATTSPVVATEPVPTPTEPVPAPVVAPVIPQAQKSKGGWGAIVAIILIVGLLITAALYSWGERLTSVRPEQTVQ